MESERERERDLWGAQLLAQVLRAQLVLGKPALQAHVQPLSQLSFGFVQKITMAQRSRGFFLSFFYRFAL